MAHGHSHTHGDAPAFDGRRERRLLAAFALTAITMVVEAAGGWLSGSLALLADAGHMLADSGALLFAWLAAVFSRRPADARRSFGYPRLEVLVGYTNALMLIVVAAWISIEAVQRLLQPAPILTGIMLWVAVAGLVVNATVLRVIGHAHSHDDVNVAAARLHVLGDLLGSVGAVSTALLIRYTDWLWADPLMSMLVTLLIINSAWRLLRRSAHILMEGAPEDAAADVVAEQLQARIPAIHDVHHVHVWQLGAGRRIATLHARLRDGADPDAALGDIRRVLAESFRIDHVTVQLERLHCDDGHCSLPVREGA